MPDHVPTFIICIANHSRKGKIAIWVDLTIMVTFIVNCMQ